ncbi:MAG: NADH-quinone oxidoreductase subunit A [Candidatus Sumerlaeaceae bacterium]|jgi:NADH-quinone oxidoreductase subunit A
MLELLVYTVMVFVVAAGAIVASTLLGRPRHTPYKDTPYESGIAPTGPARLRTTIPYYLVALCFLIFDVEVVFLYPWAIRFYELSWEGFVKAFIFIAFLYAGLVYVWIRKGLVWQRPSKIV